MSRLRLAVVGVGHLGRIHARLAAGIPQIELVAVVDSRPEARDALAQETGARPFAEFRDVIGEVDAAVIATPTVSHHQVASELIRAGVHVFVEKPITPSVDEADELVQMARRRQLVLQVGHVERFNPALVSVQDRLQEPKYIEAKRLSGYTFRSTDVGVVMDLMIHDIDVTLSLVRSPVASIDAVGVSVLGDHEDMVSARLRFANGAIANLTASRTSYAPARTMQVYMPTRFASIDFAARTATIVEPRADVLRRAFQIAELSEAERTHLRENLFAELLVKQNVPSVETNAIEQELIDFASAIETGRQPRVTGADGRDAVAVAEAVLDCVRKHAWDGADSRRLGPLASAMAPLPMVAADDAWSTEDTVILRRKAG
ncbi:MAG TPA: Gfo/Idh/MocA family oxidoreductase [Lacipirellula sp.]